MNYSGCVIFQTYVLMFNLRSTPFMRVLPFGIKILSLVPTIKDSRSSLVRNCLKSPFCGIITVEKLIFYRYDTTKNNIVSPPVSHRPLGSAMAHYQTVHSQGKSGRPHAGDERTRSGERHSLPPQSGMRLAHVAARLPQVADRL